MADGTTGSILRWRELLGLMALLVLGSTASAQEATTDPEEWPLTAVGRLNVVTGMGSRQHCTATLVGPRHVLTAAHCLFNRTRGIWAHPTSIHFVAAYRQGTYEAHARAVSVRRPPDYDPLRPTSPGSLQRDWALVTLERDIDIKPLRIRETPGGLAPLKRAGYRGDRSHVLTVQRACSGHLSPRPALLLHDCGSVTGESGAALLHRDGGEPEIVGVLVAASRRPGAPSVAVPATAFASVVAGVVGR